MTARWADGYTDAVNGRMAAGAFANDPEYARGFRAGALAHGCELPA